MGGKNLSKFFIIHLLFVFFILISISSVSFADTLDPLGKITYSTENKSGSGGTATDSLNVKSIKIGDIPYPLNIHAEEFNSVGASSIDANSQIKTKVSNLDQKKKAAISLLLLFLSTNLTLLALRYQKSPQKTAFSFVSNSIDKVITNGNTSGAVASQISSTKNYNQKIPLVTLANKNSTQTEPVALAEASNTNQEDAFPERTDRNISTTNQSSAQTNNSFAERMLDLVNKHRANYGLNPLNLAPLLIKSAKVKADDMLKNNVMSHYSPTLGSPLQQMRAVGIEGGVAENLAINTGSSDPDVIFNMWKNSPGHNANMLLPQAQYMGVAQSGAFFAQHFQF